MSKQTRLHVTMVACVAFMAASGASRGDELGDRDRDDGHRHCDPRSYGAVNDGKTDNTTAIQTAIDRCAQSGGGTVPIAGGGVYVSGPIELRSRVFLRISAPTVLKNTTDHTRY
jgi:polygalacturonase